MFKILIIQTAFTGDVVLATALIEKLHTSITDAKIDFLLRKGNEGLLTGHPQLNKVWVWDKKKNKNLNLIKMALNVRNEHYTHVINAHRFATSGLITFLSGAPYRAGFDKNPFSFCFTHKVKHVLSEPYSPNPIHETGRNQQLIESLTDKSAAVPKLYPSEADYTKVKQYQAKPYICIAPSSVWFTKQFPASKWVELINDLPPMYAIYILGAPGDKSLGDEIVEKNTHGNVSNLCGQLNFLQSAALMQKAGMNYANDSAPLHFASAMDAPVTAVFCSTVPAFGFGPLRPNGHIVEVSERLSCRPCGLHGHKQCPKGHFKCALDITNEQLLQYLK